MKGNKCARTEESCQFLSWTAATQRGGICCLLRLPLHKDALLFFIFLMLLNSRAGLYKPRLEQIRKWSSELFSRGGRRGCGWGYWIKLWPPTELSVLWGLYLNLFALLKPGCGRIKMMIFFIYKEVPFTGTAENGSKREAMRSASPFSYPSRAG